MMPNYNAILILEAIAAAPIPDDIKLQAVKDIRRMYEDKEYGRKCDVWFSYNLDETDLMLLAMHHLWDQSDLGYEFWSRMDMIIISHEASQSPS